MGEQQQIIYMQTRIIRLASERWNMSVKEVVERFSHYEVLQYMENCFGIFHVEGDAAILEDVTEYMKNRGAMIHERID